MSSIRAMTHSIADIARATGLVAAGDLDWRVARPAEPGRAGADDLALAMSARYAPALAQTSAQAAVLWPGADWQGLGFRAALFAPRARVALAALGEVFAPPLDLVPGISALAAIAQDAVIGAEAWIGPFAQIGPGARIGARARISGQVSIGAGAQIGDDVVLHPGVRIGARVRLGDRVMIHANAVIGADGFSFVTPEAGSVESAKATGAVTARNDRLLRIASLAAVQIGDDVEIGALTAIDRGTIADTSVGAGSKIDNLVQIGHNVQIGQLCLICGQVGIAGSARIGDRSVLGGKVGVGDQVRIGADCVIAAGSMVAGKVPAQSVYMGAPAVPRDQALAGFMAMRRVPRLIEQIGEIRRHLGL